VNVNVNVNVHQIAAMIGWHKILRWFLQYFNWVPGLPGFPWDLSSHVVPSYHVVFIVNPIGRILVRWQSLRNHLYMYVHMYIYIYMYIYMYICAHIHWQSLRNHLKILSRPICNLLYVSSKSSLNIFIYLIYIYISHIYV